MIKFQSSYTFCTESYKTITVQDDFESDSLSITITDGSIEKTSFFISKEDAKILSEIILKF